MLSNFHVFESVHIPYLEIAAHTSTPLVNLAAGYEGSSLPTDGWAASTKVLNKGQIITIAGVGEVQPRGDKRATGRLAQFTVTDDVTSAASGAATIPISPELNAGSLTTTDKDAASVSKKGFKNVTAKAANNSVITIVGKGTVNTAQTYKQSIFYERDALQVVNVVLVVPEASQWSARSTDPQSGASISILMDFNFAKSTSQIRADILYGGKTVYPEVGGRYISEKI